MSRTNWKQVERDAAALFAARRFPANSGHRLDFAGSWFIGQVKNVERMSLAAIEKLAEEVADLGHQQDPEAIGVVVLKRSAGSGVRTPMLVVMTEDAWRVLLRKIEFNAEVAV